jgi:hypothetical protein
MADLGDSNCIGRLTIINWQQWHEAIHFWCIKNSINPISITLIKRIFDGFTLKIVEITHLLVNFSIVLVLKEEKTLMNQRYEFVVSNQKIERTRI